MLLGLQPGALLITGDLVDAKTKLGQGQQWEDEWQVSPSKCHLSTTVWTKPNSMGC